MTSFPEISVLLPARNAEETVRVAVETVRASRGAHWELVFVEHGSSDSTPAIIGEIAAADGRIHVVHAPVDVHFSEALEIGRARCRGRFIARMDADDLMHPRRLAADVAHMHAVDDVVAVACRTKLVPKAAAGRGMQAYVAWQNAVLSAEDHAREIWIEQPLCHPATTFRADAVAEIGGYRAFEGPEDYDLFLRLLDVGTLVKRPVVHHGWREHHQRTTWTSPRHHRDAFARVKAEALVRRFGLRTRPLLIAGAGKEGGRIGKALGDLGVTTTAYIDVSDKRIGSVRHGVPIFANAETARIRAESSGIFALGAVGTSGARGAVRAALQAAGFCLGVDAVIVA